MIRDSQKFLGDSEHEDAEVGPEHVQRPVGEVDHGQEAEDERQSDRQQHEDHPEHEAREDLCGQRGRRDVDHAG